MSLVLLLDVSRILRKLDRASVKYKPIHGATFGERYVLASIVLMEDGLHVVHFMVVEASSCFVIGTGRTKAAALGHARKTVADYPPELIDQKVCMLRAEIAAVKAQVAREREAEMEAHKCAAIGLRSVPKRRREIFEKSEGKCHYCGVVLTLDGKWHIEHMQPKALLGSNDKSNLVASCVSCNASKRDMTEQEFMAKKRRTA